MIFVAQGIPHPQPRPRVVNGRAVSTTGKAVQFWKTVVTSRARHALADSELAAFSGPVVIEMEFRFAPPRSKMHRVGMPHTQKPDADNLAKLVMDAMQTARVIGDDSKVAELKVRKVWADKAGCTVSIEPVAPVDALPDDEKPDWLQ
jgi:Holliday junction resolvase RusA-like endonuclease